MAFCLPDAGQRFATAAARRPRAAGATPAARRGRKACHTRAGRRGARGQICFSGIFTTSPSSASETFSWQVRRERSASGS